MWVYFNKRKWVGDCILNKVKVIFSCMLIYAYLLFIPITHTYAKQDTKSKIDSYIETFMKEQQIPGASIALIHNNEKFYLKSWGITGEEEKAVTAQTPFTIGSISKSLTGLAIVKLMEEGKLSLDDPVQKYVPWFTLKESNVSAEITIKQLLTQTSGLSTYSGLMISDKEAKDSDAIQRNVKRLSKTKLTASPGEKHQYSNANFLILGAVIEEVTKQTYSDYMEQHIF